MIPFLKPISEILPQLKFYLENAENNSHEWEARVEEYKARQKEIFKDSEMNRVTGAIVPPKMAQRKGPTRSQVGAPRSTTGVYGGSEKSNDPRAANMEEAKLEDELTGSSSSDDEDEDPLRPRAGDAASSTGPRDQTSTPLLSSEISSFAPSSTRT